MSGDLQFWLRVAIEALTLFFIVVGLVGLLVPIFPGLVVIWIATLVYGLISPGAFDALCWTMFILITVLMLFGSIVDNLLMAKKARDKNAAWVSIGLGILAGIVFSLALPPLGGILAAPLALFLAEYFRRQRNYREALQTVQALFAGWGIAFLVRFAIGLVMAGLWMIWAWA